MRKYYIDNIRVMCILLLFPYHTFMVYNNFESFYVHGEIVNSFSVFIHAVSVWIMPLMFTIAGIASYHSLLRRTNKQYVKERVAKLLIPAAFGLLFLIPPQTYLAEKFHNGYTGGYFEQYLLFFTKETNLTGYTGGFTPAHLWFLAYLFIISMLALPIMRWYLKRGKKINADKITLLKLAPLFLIPLLMTPIIELGGKSIGQFFALFMLGFFVLSQREVIEKLECYWFILLGVSAIFITALIVWYQATKGGLLFDIFQRLCMWTSILTILGCGKHFLNFTNSFTEYFSKASFSIYFFHQTILVMVAYFTLKITDIVPLQAALICVISFILTIVCYEIAKRIPPLRFMFGIKK